MDRFLIGKNDNHVLKFHYISAQTHKTKFINEFNDFLFDMRLYYYVCHL